MRRVPFRWSREVRRRVRTTVCRGPVLMTLLHYPRQVRLYLRSLDPQLSRPVWLLQLGGLMNFFGNGIVFPFLVIYLHDVRGFSLTTAGLVIAASSFAQLVAGIGAGALIDVIGARRLLATGLVLQAIGFGLFPLVREP